MRRFLLWGGGLLTVLLAGVLVDAARAAPRSAIRTESAAPPALPGQPLAAAILLQRADCAGNLRLLHLLHQPEITERLRLQTLWFVGPATDSTAIRQLLPPWTRTIPLRHATRSLLGDLASLGHRSTPVVVVYDQEGRVRLTTQTPRSPREFAGLRRIIEGLTWIEEL